MHETHLIEPVIRGIEAHAKKEGARRVTRLQLKIGFYLGVSEESFRETFKLLAKGTMLEGAPLTLTFFPASRVEVVSFDVE